MIRLTGVCDGGEIRTPGEGIGIGGRPVYGVAIATCPACEGVGCPLPPGGLRAAARRALADIVGGTVGGGE